MASPGGIRAGKAYIELGLDNKVTQGMKYAKAQLNAMGKAMVSVGQKTLAVGLAGQAAMTAAAVAFSNRGSELWDMSKRTGASVEALSEFQYAAEQSGATLADVETGIKKMQNALVEASMGSGEAAEGFARLGLSISQLQGMSPEQQFEAMADAMQQIADPAARTNAVLKVMGRGSTALLPMFEELRALQGESRKFGLGMSTADAQAADSLGDAFTLLRFSLMKIVVTVGSALAPEFIALTRYLASIAATTAKWIAKNKGLVVAVAGVTLAVIAAGAALIGLGMALKIAAAGIGALVIVFNALIAAITFIASPIGIVITLIAGATAALLYFSGAGGAALSWLGDRFTDLRDRLSVVITGITDALAAGDLALAARIAWLALKAEWIRGTDWLANIWTEFKEWTSRTALEFADEYKGLWGGAAIAAIEAFGVIRLALNDLNAYMKGVWTELLGWLSDQLIQVMAFLDDAFDLWTQLGIWDPLVVDMDAARESNQRSTAANVAAIGDARDAEAARIDEASADARRRIREAQAAVGTQREQTPYETKHMWVSGELAAAQAELAASLGEAADAKARSDAARAADKTRRPGKETEQELKKAVRGSIYSTFSSRGLEGLGDGGSYARDQLAAARLAAARLAEVVRLLKRQNAMAPGWST